MRCISLKRFLIWKKVKFQQLWHLISCRFLARNPVPAEQLASSSCSPIREVSAWLSSSLVNIGMFLLNSFGTPNYLHWPCFPALQRLKEKAWDSVRSNALSLYCFPSVGSVFRIYMYSSLREWWGSYKCGKKIMNETSPVKALRAFSCMTRAQTELQVSRLGTASCLSFVLCKDVCSFHYFGGPNEILGCWKEKQSHLKHVEPVQQPWRESKPGPLAPPLGKAGKQLVLHGCKQPHDTREFHIPFKGTIYYILENVIKSEIAHLTYGLLAPSN